MAERWELPFPHEQHWWRVEGLGGKRVHGGRACWAEESLSWCLLLELASTLQTATVKGKCDCEV